MTYGEYRRTKPRVRVTRGYYGNEPLALTLSASPANTTPGTIFSGMLISQDTNGNWVPGCAAGKTPYIAFHDDTDPDVLSSKLLLGLSCAGQFEISTGYYVRTDGSFNKDGITLKASGTAGSLTLVDATGVKP